MTFSCGLLLFAAVVFAGCSDTEKAPGTAAPVVVKTKPLPATQPTVTAPQPAPQPVFAYNPMGRRDPFSPLIQKEDRKKSGDRPPLERYAVPEFKLTGVVWGGFGYNAMLEGPDGKGYFVRQGSIIGPNRGVVKKITQHSMVVEETFKDDAGKIDRKEIIIEVQKKQEGMQ